MYPRLMKRFLDIVLSICALPFILPFCLILSIAIILDDPGVPFYNGKRLGKNGTVFKMYKLRTMKQNAPDLRNPDGSTYNAEDDERLTRVGRFLRKYSLDELPQILNVLKGDMSFVGPRPDLTSQKALYEGNEADKLSVLPGITGYAQVTCRNAAPWKERIQLDIYYINHLSFRMDWKIIIKSISTVLSAKNIYTSEMRIPMDETALKG